MSATTVEEKKSTTLKELEGQVSLLRRQVTAEKKVNDQLSGQIDKVWDALKQLQGFAQEDATTIETMLQRQSLLETGYGAMVTSLEEIKEAIDKLASVESVATPDEEKLYSFLGIEAPASKWKKIIGTIVATLAASAAMYYTYQYFNRPEESIGVGVAKL